MREMTVGEVDAVSGALDSETAGLAIIGMSMIPAINVVLAGVALFHFYFNRALTIQSQATMDLTWGLSFSKASKPV